MKLLLVEDKDGMRDMLTRTLTSDGYDVIAHADGEGAMAALFERRFDLVLTDLQLPGQSGMEVLAAAKETYPDIPVVVMTAYGSIETAVEAMRRGAFDFIPKPFDPDHLALVLNKATEARRLLAENRVLRQTARHMGAPEIIGTAPAITDILEAVDKVASGDTTVLITGESGTGKELFAQLVHAASPRADGPFVAINCAAIPDQLLESEFFGHEKGAFTGADKRRMGKFEVACGGTLFLDEIGDMDMNLQAKLLRVLQDGEVVRVGGERPVPLDVRVVAATNQTLTERVAEGKFREDLYYRLSPFPLRIPPLRERRTDIPALAVHFMGRFAAELGRPVQQIAPAAMDRLMSYLWPGNVRELQNAIERAVILADGNTIEQVDIAAAPQSGGAGPSTARVAETPFPMDVPLGEVASAAQRYYETRRIRQVLDLTGGNKSRASEILQVSYKTLLSKIKEYGIEPDPPGDTGGQ
ncbi:MAG: sigma-54-dependent transcriptional regulator [Leptospirillia bacterium]